MTPTATHDERVLVLMPTARDGERTRTAFAEAGLDCAVCEDMADLCRKMAEGAGVALFPEEALLSDREGCLAAAIRNQPTWSDFPLVLLAREGADGRPESYRESMNVSLVERPVRVRSLLSVVRAALRSRRHQYEVRGHLAERERQADALRASEVQHRTILESITDAFFAVNRAWRFTYVNRQAERLLDREPGDLIGHVLWDAYPGFLGSEFEKAYYLAASGTASSATAFYPDHDRWYDVRAYPSAAGITIYFRDVTERRRSEELLDRLRRLYETALSNTVDFNYTFDLQGRFTFVNTALLDLWQRPLEEAVGKDFFELGYPPELAARLQRQIQEVIDTRKTLRDQTPYTSALGTRAYEYIFVPVIGSDGRVDAVAGSTRDITDRLRDEEALREADRKKDDFLALLAHELRNPLAPIRNGLQVIRRSPDPQVRDRSQEMMERQLGHMVRLIDDLLDVSRINRNKMELRVTRVLLADAVSSAVETARPMIEAAGHELAIEVPAESVHLDADLTRLAQVFANLLTNSAKYTEPGGRIRLSALQDGDRVVVTVQDTGIGIPPEALPRIFDMFSQVDRSIERSTGGLGIGLALVKGLVEMHGGTVTAASEGQGRGSEFTVRLPSIPTCPELPPEVSGDENGLARGPGRRILVVDDNEDSAESMAEMLRLFGNEVALAHDGVQAVEAAGAFRPQIVLMDVGMPRLNGLDATRRIREQPWGRSMSIIALTGWGQDGDRDRTRDAGCNGHLVKPVSLTDLTRLLTELEPPEGSVLTSHAHPS